MSLADIDNDDFYEMAVGNERGGLTFFNTIFKSSGISNIPDAYENDLTGLELYPNPAINYLFLNFNKSNTTFKLMDAFGRFVKNLYSGYSNDITGINTGMYLVEINVSGKKYYKKLIITQ